jgi:hypothetical protein
MLATKINTNAIQDSTPNVSQTPARIWYKAWSPHTKIQIDQIENVQRRAACWIKLDYALSEL